MPQARTKNWGNPFSVIRKIRIEEKEMRFPYVWKKIYRTSEKVMGRQESKHEGKKKRRRERKNWSHEEQIRGGISQSVPFQSMTNSYQSPNTIINQPWTGQTGWKDDSWRVLPSRRLITLVGYWFYRIYHNRKPRQTEEQSIWDVFLMILSWGID